MKNASALFTAILLIFFLFVNVNSYASSIDCEPVPENDSPCNTDDNPPIDLSGGGHAGTTCCAIGFNDDPTQDLQNQIPCNDATDDNAVWYTYSPGSDEDGFLVTVEGTGILGNMTVQQYWGAPNAGCGGTLTVGESSCTAQSVELEFGNCPPNDGDIIFIKVATAEEDCGEFTIEIFPASCSNFADECFDLGDQTPIEPVTSPDLTIDYFCATSCLTYGCPEIDAMGGCPQLVQSPTVWFQVTTDDLAAQMFTYVEPAGIWEAVWSVWSGPDCDNLEIVNFGGSPPCSDGDGTPELHQTSVFDDEENYWIAVTADPGSIPAGGIQDGNFELCVATTISAIICLGELEGGECDDESLVMEVIDRENDLPLDPDGDGLAGPFCAGEEIDINISFFYDASESGSDWLIGFVPIFGNGWDLENFDYAVNAPIGNGMLGQWHEEGGPCAPIIQEPNPILCTFVNADGSLELCNQLCSPCADCPQSGMEEGDPLPSGYFWITNGSNTGCENDCSPGEGWGIGSVLAQIDWSLTLKVKDLYQGDNCFDDDDLSISFQTFSDGVIGCWEDPVGECILDRAMFSPPWRRSCELSVAVDIQGDTTICSEGQLDIELSTSDGSIVPIVVKRIPNNNISGQSEDLIFETGNGSINDELINLTDEVQIASYQIYTDDPALYCNGSIQEFEVSILPPLTVTGAPLTYICEGDCANLLPDVIGGNGDYSYVWNTTETTPSITVCPSDDIDYMVTVTDSKGCQDSYLLSVEILTSPLLLLGENVEICNGPSYNLYSINADLFCAEMVEEIEWIDLPEELDLAFANYQDIENGSLVIDVNNSESGTYNICASADNGSGPISDCIEVVLFEPASIEVFDVHDSCVENNIKVDLLLSGQGVINGTVWIGDNSSFYIDFIGTAGMKSIWLANSPGDSLHLITIEDENGCRDSVEIILEYVPFVEILTDYDPIYCLGSEITVTVTNPAEFDSIVWVPYGVIGAEFTFIPSHEEMLSVVGVTSSGCVLTESIDISASTSFEIIGTEQVFQDGIYDDENPEYIYTLNLAGNPSDYDITWEVTDGPVNGLFGFGDEEFQINEELSQSGQYTLCVTLVDDNDCDNIDCIDITILQNNTVICECIDNCSTLELSSQTDTSDIVGYLWSTGEVTPSINVCPPGPLSYTVTVSDAAGQIEIFGFFVDCEGVSVECDADLEYKVVVDTYLDENENGVRDLGEASLSIGDFELQPYNIVYFNLDDSPDTIILDKGNFGISLLQSNILDWEITSSALVSFELDESNVCQLIEFGLKPRELVMDLKLYPNLVPRCNSLEIFRIALVNQGETTEEGIVWAEIDENINLSNFGTINSIDTFIQPNKIGWFFEDLLPGDDQNIYIYLPIPGPPEFMVGEDITQLLYIETESGIIEESSFTQTVQCSFDPNDKTVYPESEDYYTDIDEDELIYRIRFQNTGNAPAETVEIKDTLSEFLDVNTFQFIASSHTDFLTVTRAENSILTFRFDNINLPDSTTDLEGSQGFVMFSIKTVDNISEGLSIENKAGIYFDNNPPIITNSTKNIFYNDFDDDGYLSIEDCDDENASINPEAEEIANNDVDEDCDGDILIIDDDMDGFNSDEDCNDEDPLINPDAEEIPNNDVDEDCDGFILIIDDDMDGFNSDEDCNDNDPLINPDAEEIPNNDVDEDCDGDILIIDEDMDGFNSDEDCNDEDPLINPDAEEIPNNGIDEDCDGMDLVTGVDDNYFAFDIVPNPAKNSISINVNTNGHWKLSIIDLQGKVVRKDIKIEKRTTLVDISELNSGVYIMRIESNSVKSAEIKKLVVL